MTKIQFERLTPYESYFLTATKHNYVRTILMKDLDELAEVGGQLGVKLMSKHCGTCILKFIKQLGILYYEKQQEISVRNSRRSKEKGSSPEDSRE